MSDMTDRQLLIELLIIIEERQGTDEQDECIEELLKRDASKSYLNEIF